MWPRALVLVLTSGLASSAEHARCTSTTPWFCGESDEFEDSLAQSADRPNVARSPDSVQEPLWVECGVGTWKVALFVVEFSLVHAFVTW